MRKTVTEPTSHSGHNDKNKDNTQSHQHVTKLTIFTCTEFPAYWPYPSYGLIQVKLFTCMFDTLCGTLETTPRICRSSVIQHHHSGQSLSILLSPFDV